MLGARLCGGDGAEERVGIVREGAVWVRAECGELE
jgi:hypothetical protein